MGLPSTMIIAEAGVNHNGDFGKALQLVDIAYESGADFVKFQTFKASKLVTQKAQMADYQMKNTGTETSQYEMLKKLELSEEQQIELKNHCEKRGIGFMSSPFDNESALWLTEKMGLSTIKVGSGEITNGPMLLQIAQKAPKVILSTGMSTLGDIENALAVLAYGYINPTSTPKSFKEIYETYNTREARLQLQEKVTVLHCTTEYPAPFAESNLRVIPSLKNILGLEIGFSDHTPGISIPIAATAMGARVIEKHFTIDKNLPGPDHKASLNPTELKQMVKAIREVEVALGHSHKAPTPSELSNRKVARKSLVAGTEIKQGEAFDTHNLNCKRPGEGLSPMQYWDLLGQTASKDFQTDEMIQ